MLFTYFFQQVTEFSTFSDCGIRNSKNSSSSSPATSPRLFTSIKTTSPGVASVDVDADGSGQKAPLARKILKKKIVVQSDPKVFIKFRKISEGQMT